MIKEKILAAYEQLAAKYNELIEHKPHNAYYDRPNTLSLFPDVKGLKIIDAACGPGKYAEILKERGAEVVGFDFSPQMIELAQKRLGDTSSFFVHDLSDPLPQFSDTSFDIVLCALALHYVEDWNPTIQEFNRLLKPGGILIISLEHPFFDYNYYRSKSYFSIEHVKSVWGGFGKKVEINCFRRPLQEYIMPLTNSGFVIDRILEPLPVEKFKELDSRHYKELMQFPAFICIRSKKTA